MKYYCPYFLLVSEEISEFEEDEEDIYCNVCSKEKDNCSCDVILQDFTELSGAICGLDLVEHLCNPAIVNLLYNQVFTYYRTEIPNEIKLNNVNNS